MLIIERYLAREILRPAIGVFVFLVVVVLVFYASQLLGRAAVEGFPMDVVLSMAILRLGIFLDVLIPIALLLGIVTGLGRLQSAHEITALAAVGGGRRRVVYAVGFWVLLLAVLVAALAMSFRPWAYATVYELERSMTAELNLERIEPGRFQVGDQTWLLYAEGRSDGGLNEVMVHQRMADFDGLVRARRLDQQDEGDGLIRLIFSGDVHSYRIEHTGNSDLIGHFDRLEVLFQSRPPAQRAQLRRAMSTGELLSSDEPIELAELHWRLVSPISVLVLALAAIAMSRINPRLGQSARVLSASIVGTLYFSVLGVLINWLEQGSLTPWPGVYLAPMGVLIILAIRYWLVQRGPGAPL
ncbi:MAG: LPS export ABC transporter permease LptF [Wenzhouxiangella sp.]|nr:MAG: LPS export ABC transporter permease LptF [Wenzhouxiangella sp.]